MAADISIPPRSSSRTSLPEPKSPRPNSSISRPHSGRSVFSDFGHSSKLMLFGQDETSLTDDEASLQDLARQVMSHIESFENDEWKTIEEIHRLHKKILNRKQGTELVAHMKHAKLNSRWWGANPKTVFEGRGSLTRLDTFKKILVFKTMQWYNVKDRSLEFGTKIETPGVYYFQHKHIPYVRFAGCARNNILETCQNHINGALSGNLEYQIFETLLLITKATDWEFFFLPIGDTDRHNVILNDTILEYNTLWPYGANMELVIQKEIMNDLMTSCVSHRWPPMTSGPDDRPISRASNADLTPLTASILKTLQDIDYPVFAKFILRGIPRGLQGYDREVKTMYDLVREIKSRDVAFMENDSEKLEKIYEFHQKSFTSKDPESYNTFRKNMRFGSGWWGHSEDVAFHKFNPGLLDLKIFRELLLEKAEEWYPTGTPLFDRIAESGVFCFQHKKIPYFRYVGQTDNILEFCRVLISDCLIGRLDYCHLATLLLCTTSDEWYFCFVNATEPHELDILENDMMLKHDTVWPYGLNLNIHMTYWCVPKFRESCLVHKWPPSNRDTDIVQPLPKHLKNPTTDPSNGTGPFKHLTYDILSRDNTMTLEEKINEFRTHSYHLTKPGEILTIESCYGGQTPQATNDKDEPTQSDPIPTNDLLAVDTNDDAKSEKTGRDSTFSSYSWRSDGTTLTLTDSSVAVDTTIQATDQPKFKVIEGMAYIVKPTIGQEDTHNTSIDKKPKHVDATIAGSDNPTQNEPPPEKLLTGDASCITKDESNSELTSPHDSTKAPLDESVRGSPTRLTDSPTRAPSALASYPRKSSLKKKTVTINEGANIASKSK
ncbi:unnamed protein product [Owenia fusiformis]|uniref:Uncharacterized protein n=1 Tax=Owenia fusiformis TaxID=6347 RepID=A0A8J1XH35_OWEFU|nr:unnamed protein product [Owenia fusiformis]